jgi:hypothetical protein
LPSELRTVGASPAQAHRCRAVGNRLAAPTLAITSIDEPRRRLDSPLSLIGDFDREITAVTTEIDDRANADQRVAVLCQLRGVGRYTAKVLQG